MGTPVRFDALRETIRVLCDLPTFSTNSPIKLATVNGLINQAVRKYFGILLEQKSDEYTTYEEAITVNAATFDTSTLTAARFHDIRRAYWVRSATESVEIVRATDELYQRSQSAEAWCRPSYALVRGLIYWLPVPNQSYTVRLWYVGIPADLVADSDPIDGGPAWEEYVVGHVCSLIAKEQEEDPSRWEGMRDEAERSMRTQKPRDRSTPRQVRDRREVRPGSRDQRWRFPWST